jgi:hypothetical protein
MNFISFKKWLNEAFPKNKWDIPDVEEYSDDLVNLVKTAYNNSPKGPFVNSKKDVIKSESDWLSIDFDQYPDLDATIFYRKPRKNETWEGYKIQGVGHDGSRPAIHILLDKMKKMLNEEGTWTEASDAMEHVLYQLNVPYVDDEKLAQQIFPNTNLKFTGDKGTYTRNLSEETTIKETIFGKPKLNK